MRDRGGAICRAARVADDAGVAIHNVIVYPHHDRRFEGILAGDGENYTACACTSVLLELFETTKYAGAFDGVVDVELFPGKPGGVALGED
jgi:hypothetical protein